MHLSFWPVAPVTSTRWTSAADLLIRDGIEGLLPNFNQKAAAAH